MTKTGNKALFLFTKWQGKTLKWDGKGPEPVLTPELKAHFDKSKNDVKPVGEETLTSMTIPGHKGNIPNKNFKIPPPPPAKGKAGDTDIDKFKPGRVVTNKSDGRKAVVAYRPTSNKVMVYPKDGGKEEYWHMDECVGSKEAKAADTLQGLGYSDKTKCPQCAGVGERTTGNKCAKCGGTGKVKATDERYRVFDSGRVVTVGDEGGSYSQTFNMIEQLQAVQRKNSPKSKEWQDASKKLQPLFKRMAEITGSLNKNGEVTRDVKPVGDSVDGMTTAEVKAEIKAIRPQISGSAGIALKRENLKRYTELEKRLTELLGSARLGDGFDHPDPTVQAKVDKYRATALKQGFKPESVEKSIKQLLDEGRFKVSSKVADSAFEKGDKVWANPIGKSGGTVKGVVARINASGQVVIESGGREHEFHPSNVHASDVKPVGDADPWSPFSDPDVPPALLKAYSDAFDKAWAEKNSSKKAVLQQAAEKAFEACKRAAAVKRGRTWGETADVKPVGDDNVGPGKTTKGTWLGKSGKSTVWPLDKNRIGTGLRVVLHEEEGKTPVASLIKGDGRRPGFKTLASGMVKPVGDAGGTYDVSYSLNGPMVFQVTASQFHEWGRKNGVNLSNFKSVLEGLRKFSGDPRIKDWEMDA